MTDGKHGDEYRIIHTAPDIARPIPPRITFDRAIMGMARAIQKENLP